MMIDKCDMQEQQQPHTTTSTTTISVDVWFPNQIRKNSHSPKSTTSRVTRTTSSCFGTSTSIVLAVLYIS